MINAEPHTKLLPHRHLFGCVTLSFTDLCCLKTKYCPLCIARCKISAAIFLMLKNPVGLTALCNRLHRPCQSLNVFSCTLFIRQYLRTYFNIASLKRPEARDVIISFYAIECLPRKKAKPRKTVEASLPCKQRQ